jgi:hypothetical protein
MTTDPRRHTEISNEKRLSRIRGPFPIYDISIVFDVEAVNLVALTILLV